MYLLSTKPVPPGRRKRSSQNEGSKFLQGLRQRVGSDTFDSFMAVQGDVSLMFVIDDTGSMSGEIQATKNIAIDIINYPRNAPIVTYILSPFNDPYPGKCTRKILPISFIACVASVSVSFSELSGACFASRKRMPKNWAFLFQFSRSQKAKRFSNLQKSLWKRLLRRLVSFYENSLVPCWATKGSVFVMIMKLFSGGWHSYQLRAPKSPIL